VFSKWSVRKISIVTLLFDPECKGAGQLATAGKGCGLDGVVQLQAKLDLEMVFDVSAAAKAIGDGQWFISSRKAGTAVMVKAFQGQSASGFRRYPES
jgi:hypothetical protein